MTHPKSNKFRHQNDIRADFSAAMSAMYQLEVPAYGELVDIVTRVNEDLFGSEDGLALSLTPGEDTTRITQERHGAIRLGTADELAMMARIFAVMGMKPVSYYDLSVASIPVHATAFRPITRADLAHNPFRVFTSLLRLDLIEDRDLNLKAKQTLSKRSIFTSEALRLTEKAELDGGLDCSDASIFVSEVLETFRWHSEACVDIDTFEDLIKAHRLIADVVSFKGPHINHLTPRTLDIDQAQRAMIDHGLPAKAVIEGPPRRKCPILLRQTAFKALNEKVRFRDKNENWVAGHHTARFGEIEQRGVALTPRGRDLYDSLLAAVRSDVQPKSDGSNAIAYTQRLKDVFAEFPDDWRELHDQGLAYFKYSVTETVHGSADGSLSNLLDEGVLTLSPIIYEDFLPVSAAGIFQSNLGNETSEKNHSSSTRAVFEAALGQKVFDEFALYEDIQTQSLKACFQQLSLSGEVA